MTNGWEEANFIERLRAAKREIAEAAEAKEAPLGDDEECPECGFDLVMGQCTVCEDFNTFHPVGPSGAL